MVIKWKEGELETLKKEIKEAKSRRKLVGCQGYLVFKYAEELLDASVADRKEFAEELEMNNVSELNRVLAIYRYGNPYSR